MVSSTRTSKGHITVPQAVRESLHLRSGTRVYFRRTENGEYVISTRGAPVSRVYGLLKNSERASLEDMDNAIWEQVEDAASV